MEEIEVTLWRPAPRKPHAKPKRDQKRGDQKRGDKHEARGKGKKGKPQKDGRRNDRGPRRIDPPMMHEPRHRKTADPNSPFAVLAGLKTQLSDDKPKDGAKQSEKAE